jgi:hypothetical protein
MYQQIYINALHVKTRPKENRTFILQVIFSYRVYKLSCVSLTYSFIKKQCVFFYLIIKQLYTSHMLKNTLLEISSIFVGN